MRFQKAKKFLALLSVFLCLSLFLSVTAFAVTNLPDTGDYYSLSYSGDGTVSLSTVGSGSSERTRITAQLNSGGTLSYVLTFDYASSISSMPHGAMTNGASLSYTVTYLDGTIVSDSVSYLDNAFTGIPLSGALVKSISVTFSYTSSSGRLELDMYDLPPLGETEPPVTTPLDPLFDNVGSASTSLFGVMGQVVQFVAANWVMLIPLLAWLAVLAFKSARKSYKG